MVILMDWLKLLGIFVIIAIQATPQHWYIPIDVDAPSCIARHKAFSPNITATNATIRKDRIVYKQHRKSNFILGTSEERCYR